MKAGLIEIADIMVVNKADREGAERTLHQLKGALSLRAHDRQIVPVLKTVATTGAGIDALADAVQQVAMRRLAEGAQARRRRRARYLIARAAAERIARRVKEQSGGELDQLADAVLLGTMTPEDAAGRLLKG
jgi:LAO/AO transport system kinase